MERVEVRLVVVDQPIPARDAGGKIVDWLREDPVITQLEWAIAQLRNAEVRCDAVVEAEMRISGVLDALLRASQDWICVNCGDRVGAFYLTSGMTIRLCDKCEHATGETR